MYEDFWKKATARIGTNGNEIVFEGEAAKKFIKAHLPPTVHKTWQNIQDQLIGAAIMHQHYKGKAKQGSVPLKLLTLHGSKYKVVVMQAYSSGHDVFHQETARAEIRLVYCVGPLMQLVIAPLTIIGTRLGTDMRSVMQSNKTKLKPNKKTKFADKVVWFHHELNVSLARWVDIIQ